ncbi:MAG: ABC transporter ATP-binding protein [Candidatus Omnitrophota bacterium]|nr:ABC transporter ATP-binding protein [Candidatus Omnitrophota bacterium]
MNNSFILEAVNLHKSFKSGNKNLHVLKGIELKVNQADSLSIVGPSGAGKSTLLHILAGLDKPSEGKVFLEGKELSKFSDEELAKIRNKKMGFVFQFYHLLPEFNALENVILPALISQQKRDNGSLKNKGMELLKEVGLTKRYNHRPSQLSGGEQQRLAIARAIVNSPEILFCDEPTGNLDSQNGEEIMGLLLKLNQQNGMTILIVTHDIELARKTKMLIHIQDGKIMS